MRQARPQSCSIPKEVITSFELRLRKKMLHARINTFFRNYYDRKKNEIGQVSQGGFSLRDDLYAVLKTKRTKRK